MLTNEDKKYILLSLLENIEDISDKEYQSRVWIRGEGPEADDFTETVCLFFDYGEGIIEEYREFGITESQYKILKEFSDQFEDFVDNREHYLPEDFIDTLWWQEIVDLAEDVLKAFNYKKRR